MKKENYNNLPPLDAAFKYLDEGREKEAFSILRKMQIGISKAEADTLGTYCEILNGRVAFMKSIGINTEEVKKEAYDIANSKLRPKEGSKPKRVHGVTKHIRKPRLK